MIKITREKILKASIEVLKKRGNEGLSLRNIAKEIGCSTQPIYSEFKNKSELETALYEEATRHHKQKVSEYWDKIQPTNYKAFGLGYIKFAKEEKELFRFLYMQKRFQEAVVDVNYDSIIDEIQKNYNFSLETAKRLHGDMTVYSYGLAVLENLGLTNFSEKEISDILTNQFQALFKHYSLLENNKE